MGNTSFRIDDFTRLDEFALLSKHSLTKLGLGNTEFIPLDSVAGHKIEVQTKVLDFKDIFLKNEARDKDGVDILNAYVMSVMLRAQIGIYRQLIGHPHVWYHDFRNEFTRPKDLCDFWTDAGMFAWKIHKEGWEFWFTCTTKVEANGFTPNS